MKQFNKTKIALINKGIAEFMGSDMFEYRDSGMLDIKGNKILEGSIINANGYNSNPAENYFHVVEFYEGQFGSDIYGDFDKLSSYQTIEVIGHAKDYLHLLDDDNWEGNLGAAMKGEVNCKYHSSWDALMPVINKIATEIRFRTRFHLSGFPINVTICGSGGTHIAINEGNCAGEEYKGERGIADTMNLNYMTTDETMHYKPIELAWIAVAQFIEWYKKNKETYELESREIKKG